MPEQEEKSSSPSKMTSLTGEDLSANYDLLTKHMHFKIAGVAGLGAQDVSAAISIDRDVF